jgi:hypothetical protein
VRVHRAAIALAILLAAAACSRDEPAVTVTDVTAYAGLPGQPAGVAYFSLKNSRAAAVTLRRVSSPEFGRVEMHTTLVDDGIARMMALDSLTVAERSGVDFAPGGPHLMLMEPVNRLAVGDVVTLEFHFDFDGEFPPGKARQAVSDEDGLLAVRAQLKAR